MTKDYYKILGIDRNASKEVIKKAYRKLARQYHPDLIQDEKEKKDAEERFKDINEAYAVLSDEAKRKEYNVLGQQFREKYSEQEIFHGFNSNDIFANFFSADETKDFLEFFFRDPYIRKGSVSRVVYTVLIGLEDVLTGKEINLIYKTFESLPGYPAIEKENKIEVKVPAGIHDGQTIRLKGAGSKTVSGIEDIYLQVRIREHPLFARKGDDIYSETQIRKEDAQKGGKIKVPTLENNILDVKVPAGITGGQKLRIKGYGLPDTKTKVRGDLYINVRIKD